MSFKQRSPRKAVKSGKSVKERVEATERNLETQELKITQQQDLIDELQRQNTELVHAIQVFKSKLTETVAIEAERVTKDMKVKHGVLKAKNKQLTDLVIEQTAEKQMLISQIEVLDERLANLEDSVGI
tara:strand:- start:1657 stop:2040 length:384 start_codon:yes stop_codon:yes gene_type:complete